MSTVFVSQPAYRQVLVIAEEAGALAMLPKVARVRVIVDCEQHDGTTVEMHLTSAKGENTFEYK